MLPPTADKILEVGFGFWASKVLLSAVEMELFTELAKQPEKLETLQARLGLHSRSARDFLDALVAMGFLRREGAMYHNTPETDLFLDKRKPSYLGGILEMSNNRLYGFWGHLTEALRTGQMQNEAKEGGENFFATFYAEPERLKDFLRAMTGVSHRANICMAKRLPWSNYESFVDVGTAQGDLAVQIAKANPHLKGIGYDLPEVGPVFEDYVTEQGLVERLHFVGGDFFKDELPSADVILMGHILHDWSLPEKKILISKAYASVAENGVLVAYDAVIDDERRENLFGLLMSLNMLIETPAGFDYTGAECCTWMREAGFRQTRVEHLIGPDSMVVGIK